jgi:hypothetical protein
MPRYFFHVEDGERITDRRGQELPWFLRPLP